LEITARLSKNCWKVVDVLFIPVDLENAVAKLRIETLYVPEVVGLRFSILFVLARYLKLV
jgi:hypothetical protein